MIEVYKKSKYSIYLAAYATMALTLIWGLYFLAPTPIKLIFSIGMWSSICTFPFILIKQNDFSKWGNMLLRACILMAVIQIARTIFNTDASLSFTKKSHLDISYSRCCFHFRIQQLIGVDSDLWNCILSIREQAL